MPAAPTPSRRALAKAVRAYCAKEYPDATCALRFTTPLELLVATILSAQCTDARVNLVTPALFAAYRSARDFAEADPAALMRAIHACGFYRVKAKSIMGAAALLVAQFGGQVPRAMDDLLTLPGVARKTANVVLGTAFGMHEGIVVDTHVQRVSVRLGLTDQTVPVKIERDLMALVPRNEWTVFGHRLGAHGRARCLARKPRCAACGLRPLCCHAGNPGSAP
ncbi:MAG: endonuclease III [bacterium]|nr:endonuclease III [bacterium]